jgi:catechol 2,3-dioxygenase-like lactoylglutathione lyase family enzyme
MNGTPALVGFDHVHVLVRDRAAAVAWYRDVLGMTPVAELAAWQADGGPLTLADAAGRVHIALFERAPEPRNPAVVALGATATAFVHWRDHLARVRGGPIEVVDHELSLSLYLRDPDGNPYEITTYEHAAARAALRATG